MTQTGAIALVGTAATVGVIHTLLGPDHYIPFIAMSRAGRWSLRKTMGVTLVCGLAHVLSSVLLGVAGVAAGSALGLLTKIEAARGDVAGWLLVGFGVAYTVWGVRRALRNKPHAHWHAHADGTLHSHVHVHHEDHVHVHARAAESEHVHDNSVATCADQLHVHCEATDADPHHAHTKAADADHVHQHTEATDADLVHIHSAAAPEAEHPHVHRGARAAPGRAESLSDAERSTLTGWALFTVFIFGPCEPLIPLMMAPAAMGRWWIVALVTAVFGAATIGVMTGLVYAGSRGARRLSSPGLERFAHAGAGLALTACGLAVKFGL
ncbi:MAG: hypothetical protein IT449_17950 [Phycisphaerales bacterium]|nr:hypothetical protein [Phycisphaerales bacterium]